MNDSELIAAIRRVIRARPRKGVKSAELRDLEKYDQIVGLVTRHREPKATPLLDETAKG